MHTHCWVVRKMEGRSRCWRWLGRRLNRGVGANGVGPMCYVAYDCDCRSWEMEARQRYLWQAYSRPK